MVFPFNQVAVGNGLPVLFKINLQLVWELVRRLYNRRVGTMAIRFRTRVVGQKSTSDFGLYDLHRYVDEWYLDFLIDIATTR